MSATPCTKRHACKSSAAMPGVNTHTLYGWEMEHYFYDQMDTEEDFFKSTAPSEDIWKKFELLPTPPMSPSRTLDGDLLLSLPGDRLGWAPPKVLTCDDEYEGLHKFDPLDIFGNLGSIVIKDCMWSGFSTSQRLEKAHMTAQVQTSTSQHPQKGLRAAPGTPVSGTQAAQCVNPAAVLELPVPHNKKVTAGSSGSECRSDSSDDDDDEEEDDDDDDEIDVVSVDNRPKRGRPPSRRTPVTITVSADPFGPCPKRFHVSLHRQQHNYAAPSPDTDPEEDDFEEEESVSKRPRLELPSPLSSPATSDSEDSNEQRRNFLERKRRDDLRSRFQALREEIPGLSGSSKTSKVAILTHATEYLLKLHACQRRQAQEKRKLKAKQQQLLRRISVLQNS